MHRSRLRLVALASSLALVPGSLFLQMSAPAGAAPAVPTEITANTTVSTLAAEVLGLTLPSPLGSVAAANIRVDESIGSVSGTDPRTRASSRNLGAGAVGLDLTGILSEASQSAPPDNATPATGTTIPTIPAAPLLTAAVSEASAHARWAADNACLPAATPLTTSTVSTADVSLLEIPGVGSLLDLPGTVSTTQSVTMEATGGANDQRSVVAHTSSNLVSAKLFDSVTLGVSEAPQLTATATGLTDGSTVTYNQPVVTVTAAGAPGSPYVLDVADEAVAFALPENPLLSLELRLGALTEAEAADGTSASGSAALLHVRLFLTNALTPDPADGTDVALVQLVPMTVTGTAPAGGIVCAEVDTTAPAVAILTPSDGSSTTDVTPVVTGTTEPGASVTVIEGSTVICTTTADPTTGAWSCTPATPLALGSHTLVATAADPAGNTATASTTFTVVDASDTTAPAAPVITAPADGSSTPDTTPAITGTGEPGATVTVTEGSTVLCTAVVAGDGTWSCTPTTPLAPGRHTVAAIQADAAGNVSPADGTSFSVTAPTPTPNPDRDGDGLPNQQEGQLGTDPDNPDTDGDGLRDGQETNQTGTHPLKADTDGDRLRDGHEVNETRTEPLKADTDRDGLKDGREVRGMKIRERFEVCGAKTRRWIRVTTDPLRRDTDRDGLLDGREVKGYVIKQRVVIDKAGHSYVIGKTRSNPTKADTDRDRVRDKQEKTGSANKKWRRHKTDPTKCDTDQGGLGDGIEINHGSDPADWHSNPGDPGTRPLERTTLRFGLAG